jgi:NADH-quinone oxidoreductase subunit D
MPSTGSPDLSARDTARREITLAVGSIALAMVSPDGTPDIPVDLGAQHPSAHGLLRLRLVLEGDRIVSAEPIVGAMHRGAEKLFEVRDYRQAMVLANRHDWLSAFSNELGIALAVERMLGMDVPVRATWARTLLAELNRVLSHLAFLGSFPDIASPPDGDPIAYYLFDEREAVVRVMEEASGGRMHYMANQVGGLKQDLPEGW